MNSSINKTLIALLVALKELKIHLSTDEQANPQDVRQQLLVKTLIAGTISRKT
jgi:hypothetical protein